MTELDKLERKALRHIVANGDDRNIPQKQWKHAKRSLWEKGLITRRIGDWAWVATDKGRQNI